MVSISTVWLSMVTFVLSECMANPRMKQLEQCRKRDVFEMAANYRGTAWVK